MTAANPLSEAQNEVLDQLARAVVDLLHAELNNMPASKKMYSERIDYLEKLWVRIRTSPVNRIVEGEDIIAKIGDDGELLATPVGEFVPGGGV